RVLYGASPFLGASRPPLSAALGEKLLSKGSLIQPLVNNLAGVAPAVALLALAALGARRWLLVAAGVLALLGYAVVAFVGADFAGRFDFSNVPFGPFAPVEGSFALDYLIFGLSGISRLG